MPQDDNSSQVNNNPHQRREAFIGRINMVFKKVLIPLRVTTIISVTIIKTILITM
jgi:hypothetical protein